MTQPTNDLFAQMGPRTPRPGLHPKTAEQIDRLTLAPDRPLLICDADEVLLIKGWDSLDDGRARFTPHGAFEQPDTPAGQWIASVARSQPADMHAWAYPFGWLVERADDAAGDGRLGFE